MHRYFDLHLQLHTTLLVACHLGRFQLIPESKHIAHDSYLDTHRPKLVGICADTAQQHLEMPAAMQRYVL